MLLFNQYPKNSHKVHKVQLSYFAEFQMASLLKEWVIGTVWHDKSFLNKVTRKQTLQAASLFRKVGTGFLFTPLKASPLLGVFFVFPQQFTQVIFTCCLLLKIPRKVMYRFTLVSLPSNSAPVPGTKQTLKKSFLEFVEQMNFSSFWPLLDSNLNTYYTFNLWAYS